MDRADAGLAAWKARKFRNFLRLTSSESPSISAPPFRAGRPSGNAAGKHVESVWLR